MITGPLQRKIVLMPSSTRRPSLPNSGPRWSITGMSIARRMRSGTGVGPGICRKCRPAVREEFFDMAVPRTCGFAIWRLLTYQYGAVESYPPSLQDVRAGCDGRSRRICPKQPTTRLELKNDRRATAARPGTQAESRDHGRRDVRPFQPRALCDRCLALPDDAA